jgi:hypothetical protein
LRQPFVCEGEIGNTAVAYGSFVEQRPKLGRALSPRQARHQRIENLRFVFELGAKACG